MLLPIALLGSASDHGGRIIRTGTNDTVDGVPIACEQDLHECPIPGHGVTPIIEGSSNDWIEDRRMAYVGCRAGCGARITQGTPSWLIDVDLGAVSSAGLDAMRQSGQSGFDEHFVFVDQETGRPAEGMHYEVQIGARRHEGTSGADGRTDHAVTLAPTPVQLIAVFQQRIGVQK